MNYVYILHIVYYIWAVDRLPSISKQKENSHYVVRYKLEHVV